MRSYLAERSVVDVAAGIAIGLAAGTLVSAIVAMLVGAAADHDTYVLTWAGHAFELDRVLVPLVTLAGVLALVAVAMSRLGLSTWRAEELRQCPHCLSDIPAAAPVCEFCTRDVEPGSERLLH
jgi:large conductance mechanosensitive channel